MKSKPNKPFDDWSELEKLVRSNLEAALGISGLPGDRTATPARPDPASINAARATIRLQQHLMAAFSQAVTQFNAAAIEPGSDARTDPAELCQHFIECYENAYQKMLRTDDYSRAFAAWVNAMCNVPGGR